MVSIRIQRRGLVPALIVAVVGTIALYYASTAGFAAWTESRRSAPSDGVGYLPTVVENAPATVPTTDVYGPPGTVSVVYAGTEVDAGLTGTLDEPWIAISSQTGDYRALDVPHLPDPSGDPIAVSPDGGRLAWVGDGTLTLYDTVTGDVSEPDLRGVDTVGQFSPDGDRLLVHADGLKVLDVASGDVVAERAADADAVAGAAWRPSGRFFDFVDGTTLMTVTVPGGTVEEQPTDIPEAAQLAWSPDGERLADLHEESGGNRLFLSALSPGGRLQEPVQVDTTGLSLQRIFGFSGPSTVAANAYLLESGSVERVLDVSLTGGTARDLTTLPPPGDNWIGSETLSVASATLVKGSYAYENQLWPWSYLARLSASALLMFFLFGLYVTRRPRERKR